MEEMASHQEGDAARAVHVHGVAVHIGWQEADLSLGDFIYRGVRAAVADSGVDMRQIESVVLASHDLIDGRSLSSMVTAPPAGAYLRDEIRLSEDGLAALSLAAARIEAGEVDYSIVAAWGRSSEGDYRHVSRASMDPGFTQPFGVDELLVSAMRMTAWLQRHPGGASGRAAASAARSESARRNDRAIGRATRPFELSFPLQPGEGPALADVVVAVILGRAPTGIRIAGIGHGTDQPAIGDRDLPALRSLRDAASIAAASAGIAGDAFDLYELDGMTLGDEAMALEAVGLAPAGGGLAVRGGDARANPSGGSAAAWAYPVNGLLRFAEACHQLRGTAGAVQLAASPRTALVSGFSSVAAQTATAVALEVL
jgi:hypothetical protein